MEVVGRRRVPFVQACTLIKSIAVKDNMGLCLWLYKITPRSFSSQPCLFQRQPQQNSGGLLLSLTGFGPRVSGVPKDPREAKHSVLGKYEIYSKGGGKHKTTCNNNAAFIAVVTTYHAIYLCSYVFYQKAKCSIILKINTFFKASVNDCKF